MPQWKTDALCSVSITHKLISWYSFLFLCLRDDHEIKTITIWLTKTHFSGIKIYMFAKVISWCKSTSAIFIIAHTHLWNGWNFQSVQWWGGQRVQVSQFRVYSAPLPHSCKERKIMICMVLKISSQLFRKTSLQLQPNTLGSIPLKHKPDNLSSISGTHGGRKNFLL